MAFLAPVFKAKFPDGTTMQEITRLKYGKTAGIFASIGAFVYSTNTMEIVGISIMLNLVTGLPLWAGLVISTIVIVVYTWTGGLWAVTITDFVQFIAMMICVGIALIVGWKSIGGYEAVYDGLFEWIGEEPDYYFSAGAGYLTPWTLFAYSITSLAVLCEPAFFQRVFASSGPNEIKKAFAAGVPMWLSFDWAVTFLGIMGAAAIGLGIIPEVEANAALFAVAGQYLPVGVLGLFVAGVLAAAMSTADSYFLVSGGVIGYDIYKGVINPKADGATVEKITKVGILISAALSLFLCFVFEEIMEIWVFQATIILSVTLVPVYFGTFSKKPPKKMAGLMATVLGVILSFAWYILTETVGYYDEEMAVQAIDLFGVELWQDYGILIIVPIVAIVYLITNAVAKKTMEEAA
jgi:Na+/proline symporter